MRVDVLDIDLNSNLIVMVSDNNNRILSILTLYLTG